MMIVEMHKMLEKIKKLEAEEKIINTEEFLDVGYSSTDNTDSEELVTNPEKAPLSDSDFELQDIEQSYVESYKLKLCDYTTRERTGIKIHIGLKHKK